MWQKQKMVPHQQKMKKETDEYNSVTIILHKATRE